MLRVVEIEITLNCNSLCKHCYSRSGWNNRQFLDLETIKRVMKDLKEMGIMFFDLVGGEPLLHPNFFDIIEYAREIGLGLIVNTNGFLVTEELARKIKEKNPEILVSVSLDGHTPEINDFVRGERFFERALRGTRNFQKAGFQVVWAHVLNAINWKYLENFVNFAIENGIYGIYLDRFFPTGRGEDNRLELDMTEDKWMEAILYARSIVEKYKGKIKFFVEESISGGRCPAGLEHLSILVTGDVVPCGHFRYNPQFYLGNIKEKSIKEIYKNFSYEKFFPVPYGCESCVLVESCRGGCKISAFLKNKDLHGKDISICRANLKAREEELKKTYSYFSQGL